MSSVGIIIWFPFTNINATYTNPNQTFSFAFACFLILRFDGGDNSPRTVQHGAHAPHLKRSKSKQQNLFPREYKFFLLHH